MMRLQTAILLIILTVLGSNAIFMATLFSMQAEVIDKVEQTLDLIDPFCMQPPPLDIPTGTKEPR